MELNPLQIILGLCLSIVLGLISFRVKALTFSGVIGLIIIGIIVFGLGGLTAAVPLLFFYISSSLLSYIKTPTKETALRIADKIGPRDIRQVLANGGTATIAIIVYNLTGNMLWYFLYLTALAEAAADTWATEIGTLSHHQPVSIITFRQVISGHSGGVTITGTLAALTGAVMTTLSGLIIIKTSVTEYSILPWIIIAACGWLGSIFDSILGASVQAQYKCIECGLITEKCLHCGKTTRLHRGLKIINNDIINFFSTLLAVVSALVLLV